MGEEKNGLKKIDQFQKNLQVFQKVIFKQQYQMLSGTLRTAERTVPIEGRVRGEEITFKAGGKEYRGRLNGKSLELK